MNEDDKSARILKQSEQRTTKRNIGYLEELITKLLLTDKILKDKQEQQQANEIILKEIRRKIIEDKEFKSDSFDDYIGVLNIVADLLYVNSLD